MFEDLKEVATNHGFATANVDVEHLQVAQFVQHRFCLFGRELMRVSLTAAGQTMHALEVACIGEFPCETDRGVKPRLHLCNKRFSGHEQSPK